MKPGLLRGTIHVLLAFAFLAGLAGEALGQHVGHGHDHRTHCTCVGTCHGAAASPVPARPIPDVVPTESTAGNEPTPTDHRLLPRASRYLLPLANAPPGSPSIVHA